MNDRELAAHDYITVILDQATQGFLSYQDVASATYNSLESFRPRCPACGSVVSFTNWYDGLRGAQCRRCPHRWKEAR